MSKEPEDNLPQGRFQADKPKEFAQARHYAKLKEKWKQFEGKRTVLHSNRGVVVCGMVVEYDHGIFRFEDVVITTNRIKTSPPFVYIHQSSISHIHPEAELETIPKDTDGRTAIDKLKQKILSCIGNGMIPTQEQIEKWKADLQAEVV